MAGYVIIARDLFDSAVWREDSDTVRLFIWLIGTARFSK